ncbi:MAG: aminotransferase class IV [Phycisphaerales bacterium]|jgi:branched-subunit amino acid aminotransferase/4-amino-4-deoxychorismate lyase|nr:aminotransferase class IV [Phycisphaerales bacterium]
MDVWINGEFVSDGDARVSVFDAGLQHGIGLFETMAARNGRCFRVGQHVERLIESARLLRLTDRLHAEPIETAVQHAIDHAGVQEARVRLTVTGGDLNALRSTGAGPQDPTLFIVTQPPTEYPETFFSQGVAATLAAGRLNPWQTGSGHKTLNYWPRIAALQAAATVGAGEALWLTPDAHVASGSVSNLFLMSDGCLVTPPARGEQARGELIPPVLPGVTRAAVIELAEAAGLQVQRRLPSLDDVMDADEVFLTNSSWQVLPVTSLGLTVRGDDDDAEPELRRHRIGEGEVGPTTADLRAAVLECMEQETRQDAPA